MKLCRHGSYVNPKGHLDTGVSRGDMKLLHHNHHIGKGSALNQLQLVLASKGNPQGGVSRACIFKILWFVKFE